VKLPFMCRYLLRLMYENGARLRFTYERGWWVDVNRPQTDVHYTFVDRVIAEGAVREVKSKTNGERNLLLTDLGRDIGRAAQSEYMAALDGGSVPSPSSGR
jgi:hypothetical protein